METFVKSITNQPVFYPSRLGKEIKITPKAHIIVMNPGYKKEYLVESIEVLIGIGNDHTASLIMTKEAWEALQSGEKINITTTEQYKKQYEYKVRK